MLRRFNGTWLDDNVSGAANGSAANQTAGKHSPRGFPWGDFLSLWAMCFLAAWSIPRLAKNIPIGERTDFDWWHTAVIQQVDVLQYTDNNADSTGCLKGVTSSLDYLHSLGVGAVRLRNIYKSDKNGATTDFYDLSPTCGSIADFDDLVKQVHEKGLRLILDINFVYTSEEHPWFSSDQSGGRSEQELYAVISQPTDPTQLGNSSLDGATWTNDVNKGMAYMSHVTSPIHPMLNHSSPDTRLQIQAVLQFWLSKGVDGFVMTDIDHTYVEDGREAVDGTTQDVLDGEEIVWEEDKKTPGLPRDARRAEGHTESALRRLTNSWAAYLKDYGRYKGREILFAAQMYGSSREIRLDLQTSDLNLLLLPSPLEVDSDAGRPLTYRIRERLTHILGDKSLDQWLGWNKVCPTARTQEVPNSKAALRMLSLLLAGTPIICPGDEALWDDGAVGIPSVGNQSAVEVFLELMILRQRPAFKWGEMEVALTSRDIFSFVRFAFGRLHPRYLVVLNLGDTASRNNFTLTNTGSIKIADTGTRLMTFCSESAELLGDSSRLSVSEGAISLDNVTLSPGCSVIIEFMSLSL